MCWAAPSRLQAYTAAADHWPVRFSVSPYLPLLFLRSLPAIRLYPAQFTVDLSKVPAGTNAAIYFVAMDQYGWQGATYSDGNVNQAGWTRGLGYCDAQCPTDVKWAQDWGWNMGTYES